MTKKFSKKYLMEELELPYNSELVEEEKIIGTTRWSIIYEIVFFNPKDKKYYCTTYSVGATECQDETPWEYDNEIECAEVEQRKVMRTEWVAI